MMEWYTDKYANFTGRATRLEYGIWLIFVILIIIVSSIMARLSGNYFALLFNVRVLIFILIIPFSAITVRRIRDLGCNGGFVFLLFTPYINLLFILILLIVKGENKNNAYGKNPYDLDVLEE